MSTICMHLISDSTGETLHAIARAIQGKFHAMEIEQYSWPLTRTNQQVDDILGIIKAKPGIVLCTIVDESMQDIIQKACKEMRVPCIPVLNRVIHAVSAYINMANIQDVHSANAVATTRNIFTRAEAIDYTITHDDGQSAYTLKDADIIIIGASRTAKTPTSVYLAYRGYKVANIPFILNSPLPHALAECERSLIVGLTVSPDRLLGLRQSRAIDSNLGGDYEYTSMDLIEEELRGAKIICKKNNWPIIDASKKSIEEIAAIIIKFYNRMSLYI